MLQPKYFVEKEESVSLEQQGGTIEERIEALLKLKDINDDSFNPINFQAAVEHVTDKKQKEKAKDLLGLLTEGMNETLDKALSDGPLAEGDVPSKTGRDELVKIGMIAHIAGKGGEKMCAATTMAADLKKVAGEDVEEEQDDDAGKGEDDEE